MLWKRYIDDVYGQFRCTKEWFTVFVTWLNLLRPGVVKVELLNVVIKIENGRLKTDLFIKPSNLQLYLNYDSNHPEPCKTGLVYGEAIRGMERCTDTQDALGHMDNLKKNC